MSNAPRTHGPWMVCCDRIDGVTHYRIVHHVETAVVLTPEHYYPETDDPPTDRFGYVIPSPEADIDDSLLANAHLIAAAPCLLAACKAVLDRHNYQGTGEPWPSLLDTVRAAIAKATGGTDG